MIKYICMIMIAALRIIVVEGRIKIRKTFYKPKRTIKFYLFYNNRYNVYNIYIIHSIYCILSVFRKIKGVI